MRRKQEISLRKNENRKAKFQLDQYKIASKNPRFFAPQARMNSSNRPFTFSILMCLILMSQQVEANDSNPTAHELSSDNSPPTFPPQASSIPHVEEAATQYALLSRICRNVSVPVINKMGGKLAIGHNRRVASVSCDMKEDRKYYSKRCYKAQKISLALGFREPNDASQLLAIKEFQQKRELIDEEMKQWYHQFTKKVAAYSSIHQLTREEYRIVNLIMKQVLPYLREFLGQKQAAITGGNCGEHAAINLFRILKEQAKGNVKVQIKKVDLMNPKGDHTFLLLQDDDNKGTLTDIHIKNDREKVAEYLENADGLICDTWNAGTFKSIRNDQTNFYKQHPSSPNDFPWTSVKVQTVSLKFPEFEKLRPKVQKFLCDTLIKLGLLSEVNSSCDAHRGPGIKN